MIDETDTTIKWLEQTFEKKQKKIENMKKALKTFENDKETVIHGDVFQAVLDVFLTELNQLYTMDSALATMIRSHEINLQAVNTVMPDLLKNKKHVEEFKKFKDDYEETTLKPLRKVIEDAKNQKEPEHEFYG